MRPVPKSIANSDTALSDTRPDGSLEDLALALEAMAFTMLDEENWLYLSGRHAEVERLAGWRRSLREASEIVRAWQDGKSAESPPRSAPPREDAAGGCPRCPRTLRETAARCKWHR